LMSDILSVSDLEAGRFEVACETFVPADVADMAIGLIAPAAREKHIFLDTDCEAVEVVGDVRIMRQALIKVLSTAVKDSPENGVVTLRGTLIDDNFVLRVTDTGAGMTEVEIHTAMTGFGRSGDAYKAAPKGGGLGVGLPLVNRLLSLAGGRMQIESFADVGTTVVLSFPVGHPLRARN
jgi:signal transduction histidine kinase